MLVLAIVVAVGLSGWANDLYNAVARSVILKSGVSLKNNVSIRSGTIDQWAGSLSTTTGYYTQATGGVDDYNNNQSMPADAFSENWTYCEASNNYCSTGDAVVCSGATDYKCYQDNRTNLVWSDWILGGANIDWFEANNCKYNPNGLPLDDGTCNTHGEDACVCIKQPAGSETGCEAIGDGNWRLPYQKELMQAYINGSWGNLPNAGYYYWSATTLSYYTHVAWQTYLGAGRTNNGNKTNTYGSRCVR